MKHIQRTFKDNSIIDTFSFILEKKYPKCPYFKNKTMKSCFKCKWFSGGKKRNKFYLSNKKTITEIQINCCYINFKQIKKIF